MIGPNDRSSLLYLIWSLRSMNDYIATKWQKNLIVAACWLLLCVEDSEPSQSWECEHHSHILGKSWEGIMEESIGHNDPYRGTCSSDCCLPIIPVNRWVLAPPKQKFLHPNGCLPYIHLVLVPNIIHIWFNAVFCSEEQHVPDLGRVPLLPLNYFCGLYSIYSNRPQPIHQTGLYVNPWPYICTGA